MTTGAIARLIEHYNGQAWTVIQDQTGFAGTAIAGSGKELWLAVYGTAGSNAIERACLR